MLTLTIIASYLLIGFIFAYIVTKGMEIMKDKYYEGTVEKKDENNVFEMMGVIHQVGESAFFNTAFAVCVLLWLPLLSASILGKIARLFTRKG